MAVAKTDWLGGGVGRGQEGPLMQHKSKQSPSAQVKSSLSQQLACEPQFPLHSARRDVQCVQYTKLHNPVINRDRDRETPSPDPAPYG